jgi:hypothetical protein
MDSKGANVTFDKHAVARAAKRFAAVAAAPKSFADRAYVEPVRSRHDGFPNELKCVTTGYHKFIMLAMNCLGRFALYFRWFTGISGATAK